MLLLQRSSFTHHTGEQILTFLSTVGTLGMKDIQKTRGVKQHFYDSVRQACLRALRKHAQTAEGDFNKMLLCFIGALCGFGNLCSGCSIFDWQNSMGVKPVLSSLMRKPMWHTLEKLELAGCGGGGESRLL